MKSMFVRLAVVAGLAVLVCEACGSSESAPVDNGPGGLNRPALCYGKCDGPSAGTFLSPYEADLAALNSIWPGDPAMKKIEDAYSVVVDMGQAKFTAPTHLFGLPVNVIPYSNEDGEADASGAKLARGDEVIAKLYPPGEIGYAIKHHRPEHRVLALASDPSGMKESMKLYDTHIELVVGVERNGEPGVITINNPQGYEQGRFGTPEYSMIFVKPVFPKYLQEHRAAFVDNIRTMMVGFNTVSEFPGDYNGGDPLAANHPDKVREHAVMMVKAVAGDAAAKEFFTTPANKIYCAELAHVSTSAGLLMPLNAATFVPLVGQQVWDTFVAELDKHNAGKPSAFTTGNDNPMLTDLAAIKLALKTADESLKPAPEYAPANQIDAERTKIAFQPMTMADIVEQFLRTHVPREQLGESVAPVQGAMLKGMKPGLLEAMAMNTLEATDPRRVAVEQLFDKLVEVVSVSYPSYADFRKAVEPLLAQARVMTGPRDATGTGLFVPPSLLHVITQGKHAGGMIGLSYEGHGVHVSATKKKADVVTPEPTPVVPPNEPMAGSCRASCGGFSPDITCACDDLCKQMGDCCTDFAEQCPQN